MLSFASARGRPFSVIDHQPIGHEDTGTSVIAKMDVATQDNVPAELKFPIDLHPITTMQRWRTR